MNCSLNLSDREFSKESPTRLMIPCINPETLTYKDFFEKYLLTNHPVMFSSGLTAEWNSVKHWVTPEGNINFPSLKNAYGNHKVTVTEMKSKMSMNYGGMETQDIPLSEFLDYWKDYIAENHPTDKPCLYLKDWHVMLCSEDVEPYQTPKFFSSDWLNETSEGDDFKFVYMGPKGSWTPFHADVYGSYSWSANVTGRKKWRLYPPGKETRFLQSGNVLVYDFENPGVEYEDYIDILQNSGEVIFVPSGWHHIVWNETDTISINHNWFNAANVCYVWHQLHRGYLEVVQELGDISDSEDFFEQCQLVLRANHGMNYEMFLKILVKVYNSRKAAMNACQNANNTGKCMNEEILKYDLQAIRHVLSHLVQDEQMKLIINSESHCRDLMKLVLDDYS